MTKFLIVIGALALAVIALWRVFRPKPSREIAVRDRTPEPTIAEVRPCRVCGTYLPAGAQRCERSDCPLS